MALTFFWRCEGTTLDGTDDFSAGDTTATATGGLSLAAGGMRVGTNGILTTNTNEVQQYAFDGASIFSHAEGALAFSVKISSGSANSLLLINGVTSNNRLVVEYLSNNVTLRHRSTETGDNRTAVTTGAAVPSDGSAWVAIVARWNVTTDLIRVEVYNASGSLIDSAETNLALDAATDTYTLKIGKPEGGNMVAAIDNVFIADTYAEPLEDYLDITSYTEYGSSGVIVTTNGLQSLNRQFGPQRSARLGGVLQ